jgi:hypothetical protein
LHNCRVKREQRKRHRVADRCSSCSCQTRGWPARCYYGGGEGLGFRGIGKKDGDGHGYSRFSLHNNFGNQLVLYSTSTTLYGAGAVLLLCSFLSSLAVLVLQWIRREVVDPLQGNDAMCRWFLSRGTVCNVYQPLVLKQCKVTMTQMSSGLGSNSCDGPWG